MAKALALLSLLLLFNGCLGLGQKWQQGRQQNQCQLNQIQAREPDNRIESEAGLTESWNPNDEQFQCAGVAMVRRTIEQNGLHLPSFVNAPQLIYIIQGRGVLGAVFSGCPETFEESQEQQFQPPRRQGGQQQQMGQQSEDQQDRHQKIRHVRQGDVIALPAGVAYWSYNNGKEPLVAVSVLDLSNPLNQLDQEPRRFYLAGNPQSEFEHGQRGQQGQRGQRQEQWGQQGRRGQQQERQMRRGQQQQQGKSNNVFAGFDPQLLAQAFNVDEETARNLQGMNDDRNDIVRVQGQLDFMSPGQDVQQQQRQRRQGGGWDNGLEETMCTMRLRQNIGDPKESDFYNPQAGRISVLNSNNLPILRYLRLNAERGVLYNNAIYTPHWNLNSNEMVYVIKGNARVQVVNEQGEAILDEEVQEGQAFLVPQNHAAIKQAGNQGFEYISFRTEDHAMVNTMAGRTSVLRAMPDQVLSNAFQISEEQARMLKYNRMESRVLSGQSSRGQWSII